MTVTVRFAPSPTGYIHIGNTRTALSNWLYAQKNGGKFILRYDDTDVERSREEYAEAIAVDLDWLGVKPDRVEYQSKRFDVYARAVEKLKEAGLLYACYETADELERRRKLRLARRLPPVYGREALKITDAEKAAFEAEGRKPHWRFLLPNFESDPFTTQRTEVHWDDLVRGPQVVDLASMSDPVLVREDGTYLYTLPSVVDDIDLGVSHIIRGDDHVTNTGVQIAIFRALGAEPPVFGHHNLLTTTTGEGLSKRTGALSVGSLRENGYEPMAVASLAILIGTSENVAAAPTMDALAERFDLASISKSSAKFDPAELDTLNRALLHEMSFADAKPRLTALGVEGGKAEPFWLAVRGNLDRFGDVQHWWQIVTGDLPEAPELSDEDRDFIRIAFNSLPAAPWNHQTWKAWTDAVKSETGRKGKGLFMPLRLALTGQSHGPELADLLVLMGPDKVQSRKP
ncbi:MULTISPECIES: glutamate--tRNA ligase [Ochrobactrum]|uniref:Glutamate--tRNA ligase n=2 Tax=Ochrobactrum TaxID=528 RepID=A0ABD5JUT5_9HYPH|nr:glutamate--tRNA ligase [[Ochrobactrum] soli]MCI0999794.1 glutamate--tRNA ligase [Ochrobactrum sp. C6C9]RRD23539.1 glutamate--tRNA ligase [Brucellaceae bacterium VT-16-1752]SPL65244.1 Glutamyl-tRNA(Gln) synthetase [[Ochrobactrum] soli]